MTVKSLSNLVYSLVNDLKFPISNSSIYHELEKHPDQFSLLAISEVLNGFQVSNGAYNLESQELDDDMCPFISHVSRKGGEFILVREVQDNNIVISSQDSKREVLKRDEFDKFFTGTILVIDEDSKAIEDDYKQNKRRDIAHSLRYPFIISSAILVVLLIFLNNQHYIYSLPISIIGWTLIKIAGLSVSVLLLIQSIDANNSFIKKICGGDKADCKTILSSKASKLTEEVSWSEIGFFYFISTTLIILFYGNSIGVLQTLAIINILALPYTVFSIYYQYYIAKKWCVLCVSTQAILWLEFIFGFNFLSLNFITPSISQFIGLLILFIVPIALWVLVKPFLRTKQYVTVARASLNSFKRNPTIFRAALTAQNRYFQPSPEFAVILGSDEPKNIITVVSSPSCPSCMKAHKILKKWLHSDETLQVQFVFSLLGESAGNENYKVAEHILSLKSDQPDLVEDALNAWYSQTEQSFDRWSQEFPLLGFKYVDGIISKQDDWCRDTEIIYTPTIMINGYRLPEPYQLEDIRYLI